MTLFCVSWEKLLCFPSAHPLFKLFAILHALFSQCLATTWAYPLRGKLHGERCWQLPACLTCWRLLEKYCAPFKWAALQHWLAGGNLAFWSGQSGRKCWFSFSKEEKILKVAFCTNGGLKQDCSFLGWVEQLLKLNGQDTSFPLCYSLSQLDLAGILISVQTIT